MERRAAIAKGQKRRAEIAAQAAQADGPSGPDKGALALGGLAKELRSILLESKGSWEEKRHEAKAGKSALGADGSSDVRRSPKTWRRRAVRWTRRPRRLQKSSSRYVGRRIRCCGPPQSSLSALWSKRRWRSQECLPPRRRCVGCRRRRRRRCARCGKSLWRRRGI